MFPVGVMFERHLIRDPGQRNIWLSAAQLTERARCDLGLSGHAGSSGEQTVATDVIASQTYCPLRQTHGLVIIPSDKLRVRGNAIVKRR